MQHLLKQIIDKEFAANDIQIVAKVIEHAWQLSKVISYRITLLYGDSRKVMEIYCSVERPYKPKIIPSNPIEPHKMVRLCEIIIEAFNELERKSEEGEGQFR